MVIITEDTEHCRVALVCSKIRVILLHAISCFKYPAAAAAALATHLLWPVRAMMCLKFKPVGDRGSCCLDSVWLMGERRRGKGTETPGERANKKKEAGR